MAKILENPTKKFEQKEVEIESKLYRMIEMLDAMKASLENAKKVKSEQELLIKVLKESEYVETFKEFIESEEKQNEDLGSQIMTLELRAELLEQAIDACKANTEIEKAMTLVLDALGVFAQ